MRLKENLAEFPSEDVDVATPWDELKDVAFAGEDEVAEEQLKFVTESSSDTCGFYLREINRMGRMDDVRSFVGEAVAREYMELSSAEMEETLHDYADALSEALSEEQKKALKVYSGYDFKLINQVSRGYWNYDELGAKTEEKVEFAERNIKQIESAMQEALALNANFVTYRGVGIGTFREYGIQSLEELKDLEGGFFVEEGFCSTSLNPEKNFANADLDDTYREKCNIEIKYYIPKESHDYIGLLTNETSYSPDQEEILINRDSLSYVSSVKMDEKAQSVQMEMVLVPLQVYDPRA